MNKLYHKNVYWNKNFDIQAREFIQNTNKISKHLQYKINSNNINYHKLINIINQIKYGDGFLFELMSDNDNIVKVVYRINYNYKYDICIVFGGDRIITAWLNDINDKHITLDRDKYCSE